MMHQLVHLGIASMFALSVLLSGYSRSRISHWCGRGALVMLVVMSIPQRVAPAEPAVVLSPRIDVVQMMLQEYERIRDGQEQER